MAQFQFHNASNFRSNFRAKLRDWNLERIRNSNEFTAFWQYFHQNSTQHNDIVCLQHCKRMLYKYYESRMCAMWGSIVETEDLECKDDIDE